MQRHYIKYIISQVSRFIEAADVGNYTEACGLTDEEKRAILSHIANESREYWIHTSYYNGCTRHKMRHNHCMQFLMSFTMDVSDHYGIRSGINLLRLICEYHKISREDPSRENRYRATKYISKMDADRIIKLYHRMAKKKKLKFKRFALRSECWNSQLRYSYISMYRGHILDYISDTRDKNITIVSSMMYKV